MFHSIHVTLDVKNMNINWLRLSKEDKKQIMDLLKAIKQNRVLESNGSHILELNMYIIW